MTDAAICTALQMRHTTAPSPLPSRRRKTSSPAAVVKLWALQAGMLLSVILPGFVTTAGLQNTFYVILPYMLWLISDIALTYTLGSMTFGGNPLRDYIYERSVVRYAFRTLLPLTGAALTAAGLLVFLLRDGSVIHRSLHLMPILPDRTLPAICVRLRILLSGTCRRKDYPVRHS